MLIIAGGLLLVLLHMRFRFNLDFYAKLCFVFFLISVVLYSISWIIETEQSNRIRYLGGFYMPLAFVFVVMHSYLQRGPRRTFILFAISLSFGLVSELLGAEYGWIFGSYDYPSGMFFFGIVPLMTPISWSIIIYMAYSMTNLIAPKMAGVPLKLGQVSLFATLIMLTVLSSMDGLLAMNIDLMLDPVAVDPAIAGWVWNDGGPYYGIPLSNFAGWFFVTFFATLIFRMYESLSTERSTDESYHKYYPAALYFSYFVIHAAMSFGIDHPELILIGVGTMMPFCIIVAYRYLSESIAANIEKQIDVGE